MKLLAIASLAAGLALAGGAHAATNVLANGSFESGLSGWTPFGTETQGFPPVAITYGAAAGYPTGAFGEAVPADSSTSLSPDAVGTHAAYFVSDFQDGGIQQSVYLAPGKYAVGFSAYAPYNGYANPVDALFSASIAGVGLANYAVSSGPAGTWQNFSSIATITTGGFYNAQFNYKTTGFPAKDIVVDRAYVSRVGGVPEPGVWAMLIMGFGAVGSALRSTRKRALTAV